ncbi:MAG: class I SAM-dependent methyltransferase [Elusimicrobiota bacterium]
MNKHKHEHSGCTRKSFEDPRQILLSAGIAVGGVMIDIGTGTGYLAITSAEIMGSTSKVYALDNHAASIEVLNKDVSAKGIKNVVGITADAVKEIPLPQSAVDVCLMSNVVHGFAANAEIDALMKNVNNVLKEDGEIVVIDFQKAETEFGPPLSVRLSPEDVENLIAPYGYKILRQFDAGLNHYGLVFQRVSLQNKYC